MGLSRQAGWPGASRQGCGEVDCGGAKSDDERVVCTGRHADAWRVCNVARVSSGVVRAVVTVVKVGRAQAGCAMDRRTDSLATRCSMRQRPAPALRTAFNLDGRHAPHEGLRVLAAGMASSDRPA